MQQSLIIISVLFSFAYGVSIDRNPCTGVEKRLYQMNVTFPGYQTFYGILSFEEGGLLTDVHNIQDGDNAAYLGYNLICTDHSGYYRCSGNQVHAVTTGYVKKTNVLPALAKNGAMAVFNYYFNFANNYETFSGTFQPSLFQTGSNPGDLNNPPFDTFPVATMTGTLLDISNFDLNNYHKK